MTKAIPSAQDHSAIRTEDVNPDPIVQVDLDGELVYINAAAINLLGTDADPVADYKHLLPPDYIELNRNCQLAEIPIPASEMEIRRRTYQWRPFLVPAAGIIHYVGFDITNHVRAEDRLRQARDKAQAGEIAKAAFLDNMTHEIRTPLNSLLGFMRMLAEELVETLNDDQRMYFDLVQQNGNRLERTMREILDASLIAAGNLEIELETVDLRDMVTAAAERIVPEAEAKGLELHYDQPSDPVKARIDTYCFEQGLDHLLDNAVKYTDGGSVTLSLETAEKVVRLVVRDTGAGMSEAYQARIFTPFNQESFGHSKHFQGIGLGLTLVRGYLDAMGANIDLDSAEGKGSTFTISLPRA